MTDDNPIVHITRHRVADVVTPSCEHILNNDTIEKLKSVIFALLRDSENKNLILDLRLIQSISSAGLGLLIKIRKAMDQKRGQLKVCCLHAKVSNTPQDQYIYELLKVVRLDTYLDICDSVEHALEQMAS